MSDKQGDEKDKLFLEEMSGVTPLHSETAKPWKLRPPPRPLPKESESDIHDFIDVNITTHDHLEFRREGIQHRLFQELQRGVIKPESTLDLHGLRVAEARSELSQFIPWCARRGYRCVRIIHGKGQRSAKQQPILKQKVNQWLPQRKEVLAFVSAPRWDGGTGAVYVLLSKKFQD